MKKEYGLHYFKAAFGEYKSLHVEIRDEFETCIKSGAIKVMLSEEELIIFKLKYGNRVRLYPTPDHIASEIIKEYFSHKEVK